MYKIAIWNPSVHPNPDDLYHECTYLQLVAESSDNDKLKYYILCLKYYLLCKAGQAYRKQKNWLNDWRLDYLLGQKRQETAILSWILARLYFSEAENGLYQDGKRYQCLYEADKLISEIQEEISIDTKILLPGIKSEAPEDQLNARPNVDPTTKIIPIPHRYSHFK